MMYKSQSHTCDGNIELKKGKKVCDMGKVRGGG
jgi:hypothetical protein